MTEIVKLIRRGAKNSRVLMSDGQEKLVPTETVPFHFYCKKKPVDRGVCDYARRHAIEDRNNNRRASEDPLYAAELRLIRQQEGW